MLFTFSIMHLKHFEVGSLIFQLENFPVPTSLEHDMSVADKQVRLVTQEALQWSANWQSELGFSRGLVRAFW